MTSRSIGGKGSYNDLWGVVDREQTVDGGPGDRRNDVDISCTSDLE